ncbi:Putative uncharacterized protein [Moritella viscosa]|uniref:Uncharacterized protein n=1 Tax=Moritella viscosa TaxID=80854 RepID=A0ABY1HMH7_9GAMM|nr:Putative uncharacterized protein [Moritella viscosa]
MVKWYCALSPLCSIGRSGTILSQEQKRPQFRDLRIKLALYSKWLVLDD